MLGKLIKLFYLISKDIFYKLFTNKLKCINYNSYNTYYYMNYMKKNNIILFFRLNFF